MNESVSERLALLERTIDAAHPERGPVPIRVLGFGEISLVFEVPGGETEGLAFKRLPIFDSERQVKAYAFAYRRYNELLRQAGLKVPECDAYWFHSPVGGTLTLYCSQEKVDPASVGNRVIHQLPPAGVERLVTSILEEMLKVWRFNERGRNRTPPVELGLDGQVSNWAAVRWGADAPGLPEGGGVELAYLDTSTPLYRVNGHDAFNPELFLKSAPSFLRWLLKWAFLGEVVGRYYSPRQVLTDLVANFFKEQLPLLVPRLVRLVNRFLERDDVAGLLGETEAAPLGVEEVRKYYAGDKRIWEVFQATRRLDRFLQTRLLGRPYPFYLPEKIAR
ncbi:MAG: DUF6206 family protein [Promethearchaeota archaeon]